MYQIVSTRTVNTQHGQSIILSFQKDDRCRCSAWAYGMPIKELQPNPMMMVSSRLFVDRKRARLVECTIHINRYSAKCKVYF